MSESQKPKNQLPKLFVAALLGGIVGAGALFAALLWLGLLVRPIEVVQTGDTQVSYVTIEPSDEPVGQAQAVAEKVLPSVVSIYVGMVEADSLGSGVILDEQGDIITNAHVLEGAVSLEVVIAGQRYPAVVLGADDSSDLAVIRATIPDDVTLVPVERGDSSLLSVGDWVMTIGSPLGLEQSVSVGVVSAISRSTLLEGVSGRRVYTNLIQTDATINPGNSGGALVNAQGQLVGIATLFSSDTETFAGIGFAIPGDYALSIADMIIAGEPVEHAYLGLSLQTVTDDLARQEHLGTDAGALAAEVFADGPAAAAGIREGDVVVAIDGRAVASADAAVIAVREHAIGEEVEVMVVRGLEQLTFAVTLGSDADMPEGAMGEAEKPDQPAPPTDDEQQELLDQIYSG